MDGDWIRALREKRGLTQEEFALHVNRLVRRKYDRSKVSRWETGAERVPVDVAGLLSLEEVRVRKRERAVTVAVSLHKGGSAKTSTTINLAYVMAQAGGRVLIVDADAQGNASLHVGIPNDQLVQVSREGKTIYEAMTGRTRPVETILKTDVEGLDVMPATISLAQIERELPVEPTTHMRDMLAPLLPSYDAIFIDCPPSMGAVTVQAMTAADTVLIPCQTEPLAILGLSHLYATIQSLRRRHNPDLGILGIIPTLYSPRLNQDRASLEDIKSAWGKVAPIFDPIPKATIYPQSAGARVITLQADPTAPGLTTYQQTIERLNAVEVTAHG